MGLGSHLHILYFLELLLPLSQIIQIVVIHQLVYSRLLCFHVLVSRPVRVESPLHARLNPRLRVYPVLVELPAIVLFGRPQEIQVVFLHIKSHRLLLVLVLPELLHPLQVPDPLRRLLFLLPQFDYPVFYLRFLIFHLFGHNNCFHHMILRLLPCIRSHA